MLPSTLKADLESLKPVAKPETESDEGNKSTLVGYIDCVSGASRQGGEGQPDHTYAKPSLWRPQNHLVKPCRYLFSPSTGRQGRPRPRSTGDPVIDVVSVDEEPPVPLPRAPAGPATPEPPPPPEEEPVCWAESISKTGWSPVQTRMLNRAMRILEDVRLSRLASKGRQDERFHLDEALERGRSRLSNLLEGVGWNAAIARWLHQLLMKHLPPVEKADYLSLLGRLKRRDRGAVEAMTSPGSPVATSPPPLDREVAEALLLEKFLPLPLDPLFFMVPNSLECSLTDRFISIVAQMRQMAEVCVASPPTRSRSATVQQGLDQMVGEARARLAEARGGSRPVVLVGWNLGAAVASLLAQLEPARALVCIGYPHRTLDGPGTGRSHLSVLESVCPVLFVVGTKSLQCGPDQAEELRSHMRVPTRLVVAGACDDRLLMTHADRVSMRLTQSMVDRSVLSEIYNFVGETLTQPPPPPPTTTTRVPAPCRRRTGDGVTPKRRRSTPRGLVVINAGGYTPLVPHHNYAATPPPGPAPRPRPRPPTS